MGLLGGLGHIRATMTKLIVLDSLLQENFIFKMQNGEPVEVNQADTSPAGQVP